MSSALNRLALNFIFVRVPNMKLRFLGSTCRLIAIAALLSSCTASKGELGTFNNPIKFFLVPSVEHAALESSGEAMKAYLEANTPYKYKISIPTSYIAVVEAFGSKRADVASLNTYGYMIAHKRFKTEARLTVIRAGESTYRSQIITRFNSGIKKLEDINGKRFAYVDPTSASGYLLPVKLLNDKGIKPKQTVFAQRHDNVISMIYQGQVDAGATYYSPPLKGEIQDARLLVLAQYPDVEKKIVQVALTDPIPNDPIVFRADLPEDMKFRIARALIDFVTTEQGRMALEKTFAVTGFKPATDKDYDSTRKMFELLGDEAEKLMRK